MSFTVDKSKHVEQACFSEIELSIAMVLQHGEGIYVRMPLSEKRKSDPGIRLTGGKPGSLVADIAAMLMPKSWVVDYASILIAANNKVIPSGTRSGSL